MSRFRDDADRFTALGAELVGVSVDTPERNGAWARHLGLPFRLLSDHAPAGAVLRELGAWDGLWRLPRRVTFVVDRARRVRWVEAGGLAIDTRRTLEAVERLAVLP